MTETTLASLARILKLFTYEEELFIGPENEADKTEKELRCIQTLIEDAVTKEHPSQYEKEWADQGQKISQEIENGIGSFQGKSACYWKEVLLKRLILFVIHIGDRVLLRLELGEIKLLTSSITHMPDGANYEDEATVRITAALPKPELLAYSRVITALLLSLRLTIIASSLDPEIKKRTAISLEEIDILRTDVEDVEIYAHDSREGDGITLAPIAEKIRKINSKLIAITKRKLLYDIGHMEVKIDSKIIEDPTDQPQASDDHVVNRIHSKSGMGSNNVEDQIQEHQSQQLSSPDRFMAAQETPKVLSETKDADEREMKSGKHASDLTSKAISPDEISVQFVPNKEVPFLAFSQMVESVWAQLFDVSYQGVITLVGMKGIGKTAVVHLIYNSTAVATHFPLRYWVSTPDKVMVEELWEEIKKYQVEGNVTESYLIVLDDVSRISDIEDVLMELLYDEKHSGRIIITTCDLEIGNKEAFFLKGLGNEKIDCIPHRLQLLTDCDSWALFSQNLKIPEEMLERSRKWVKRCGGLPLAIIDLREKLSSLDSTNDAWSKLFKDPKIPKYDLGPWTNSFEKINNLSTRLKNCLYYLNRFIGDDEIPVRRVYSLWIAEGIFDGEDTARNLEKAAHNSLLELTHQNIVQVTKRNLIGLGSRCRLPYPVRRVWAAKRDPGPPLAAITRKVSYVVHYPYPVATAVAYTSMGDGVETNLSVWKPPYDKQVICFQSFDSREGTGSGEKIGAFLQRWISYGYFLLLRVLDLERVFRPVLPEALGKLVMLKYLGLRYTYLESLPPSVRKLLNLQTLDLKRTSIKTLPASIWKMNQLRYLYLDDGYRCRFLPCPIGCSLGNLQTLWTVFIDEDSQVDNGLDRLVNLRKLGLTSRVMSDPEDVLWSKLIAVAKWIEGLKQMESLKIKSFDKQNQPCELPPLKSLSGHHSLHCLYLLGRINENLIESGLPMSLIELTLSGSALDKDPMKALEKFPNLKILKLFSGSFIGKLMHCSKGGFPQLRFLRIWGLDELEKWDIEDGAFPLLFELDMRSCKNMKTFPQGFKHPRTIKINLKVTDMPKEWENIKEASFSANNHEKTRTVKIMPSINSQVKEKDIHHSAMGPQPHPSVSPMYEKCIPKAMHSYVRGIVDVPGDGNCGFRAVAVGLGYSDPNHWLTIRQELMEELTLKRVLYESLVLDKEMANRLWGGLFWEERNKSAPNDKWMETSALWIVAELYGVAVTIFSPRVSASATFFPTSKAPPIQPKHIWLVHVNENHFVSVDMVDNSPTPRVLHPWELYRNEDARKWEDLYQARFGIYEELIPPYKPENTAVNLDQ